MASVISLGIHRPTALPYLVAEGILPVDVSDHQFTWSTINAFEQEDEIEEEIVTTNNCVVWSRGAVVKRVFRFDIEKEKVVQAVLAWFPSENDPEAGSQDGSNSVSYIPKSGSETLAVPKPPLEPLGRGIENKKLRGSSKSRKNETSVNGQHDAIQTKPRSRALVVFLKTQAHVYYLHGASHVIHLPFEVEAAFPAPRGLILQRKIQDPIPQPTSASMPPPPPPPPNSFVSHFQSSQSQFINGESFELSLSSTNPLSLLLHPERNDLNKEMPRLFTLAEPLSEVGLVTTSALSNYINTGSKGPVPGSAEPIKEFDSLVFISSQSRSISNDLQKCGDRIPYLAVTINNDKGSLTIWEIIYVEPAPASSLAQRRTPSASGVHSKKRSSLAPGVATGATTPVPRGPRESFGPVTRSRYGAMSSSQDEIPSELDPEVADPAVAAKQSRRISSLLARADLSTSHDRTTFTDLASGHNVPPTHGGNLRHGENGSRTSFGATSSHRRESTNNTRSSFGNGHSYDPPIDELLEELNAGGDFEGFQRMDLNETVGGLQKEVVFVPLESISIDRTGLLRTDGSNHKPKVFEIIRSNQTLGLAGLGSIVCLVVHCKSSRTLLFLTFEVQPLSTVSSERQSSHRQKRDGTPRLVDVRRRSGIIDVINLRDGNQSQILCLSETADGHGELIVESIFGMSMRIDMPQKLAIYNPFHIQGSSPSKKREGSIKRVLSQGPAALLELGHEAKGGEFDICDNDGRKHRLRVQLTPRNNIIARILDVCGAVLPGTSRGGEGVLFAWWQVHQWLKNVKKEVIDKEWTALVIVLWIMAVPFLEEQTNSEASKPKKRRSGFFRSSSGTVTDLADWEVMTHDWGECGSTSPSWMKSPAWSWINQQSRISGMALETTSKSRNPSSSSSFLESSIATKSAFIPDCIAWAIEFLSSPLGEMVAGQGGYLPTSRGRDPESQRTALATILVALHLLREEQKLDLTTTDFASSGTTNLAPILAQLGGWLGWDSWSWKEPGYYSLEDTAMDDWVFDERTMSHLTVPPQPFEPPSVYQWIEMTMNREQHEAFLRLDDMVGSVPQDSTSKWSSLSATLTPRTQFVTHLFERIFKTPLDVSNSVQTMADLKLDSSTLETLPEGVVAPLREAILQCQVEPSTVWGKNILRLVGREDLIMLLEPDEAERDRWTGHFNPTHEAIRDVHTICNSTFETDAVGSFDGSAEIDRQAITRLVFKEDRRFIEASKLVHSMRPAVARCAPEPDWSEADLLDAQKELVQTVAVRTLAVSSGRGLLYYSARVPLLTEKFPVTGFNLSCVMKPSNNTVTADRASFTEEKVCWAFFHAGVSAGLSISRDAKGIDSSWIIFNKPTDLSNRHAGFLLALGLNGHLKSLAKWVAFKYLTPKHTMTSIGLLLGLSASFLGTMDTLVTRLLSVHVTRMLPPGAAELNLSPLTQTAGIMGIGLLYCNTQHRRMSEVMLSEIETVDYDDSASPMDSLRDEGYRLAAGFALGYINLGRGRDLKGLHDMHLVERLLALAVGSKKVDIVHVLDKATAAATMAIALIFMKSHDEALARKIDIPDSSLQFDYVRPDVFLLRTVAKHMIMWDRVEATYSWIKSQLPLTYRERSSLGSIQILKSEDMPFFNIVAGLCFSIGLKFAGSGSLEVRNILIHYLDQLIRLCKLSAPSYDGKITRSTVRNCQDVVALSAATVMAGTGDLAVFRRLRSLHGRVDAETPYGSHLAAHIAIGALFLGGGNFTFGTSNLAVASLLCAFYPLFPNSILDNKSHLQAFRHLWVLAVEARCLVVRDVATQRPISIPVSVRMRDGTERSLTAPGLLPDIDSIESLATLSPDHWQVKLDFASNPQHLASFQRTQSVFVHRRSAHDDSHASLFSATLQALNDAQSVQLSKQIFEWVFTLPSFAKLSRAERALIIPPENSAAGGSLLNADMATTVVDDRLVLEQASLHSGNKDRLWSLRLLFEWAEEAQKQGGRMRWLGREVIEGLRAAAWMESRAEDV